MIRWSLLLASCLAAAGCAIGQSGYSCSGIPAGVQCQSAGEVLEASKATDGPVTSATFERDRNDDASGHRANPVSGIVPEESSRAVPLRTPSRVMRIWFAPWENESHDLHVAKIIYTEIEPRRWTIGKPVRARSADITPLEPGAAPRAASAPAPAAPRSTPSTAAVDGPAGPNVPRGTKPAASGGVNRN